MKTNDKTNGPPFFFLNQLTINQNLFKSDYKHTVRDKLDENAFDMNHKQSIWSEDDAIPEFHWTSPAMFVKGNSQGGSTWSVISLA